MVAFTILDFCKTICYIYNILLWIQAPINIDHFNSTDSTNLVFFSLFVGNRGHLNSNDLVIELSAYIIF